MAPPSGFPAFAWRTAWPYRSWRRSCRSSAPGPKANGCLAYPPDCPFHLNPNPTQFIEIKSDAGFGFDYRVKVLKGTLKLGGHDETGVFYRIWDAQPA